MISNKVKLLAIGIIMLGATSTAFACGDEKKATGAEASYSSTEKADGCCAMKGTKATAATATKSGCSTKMSAAECAAKMAKGECAGHMNKSASADGDHCGAAAKSTGLAYGDNTVTLVAGACPTKNDSNYAFYVAGAECKGTGTSAVQAVRSLKGVAAVSVDYDKHMVYVCADGKAASKQAIEKSLKKAGFDEVKFVSDSKQNCSKSHGKVEA